jgi:hypothetical protein
LIMKQERRREEWIDGLPEEKEGSDGK